MTQPLEIDEHLELVQWLNRQGIWFHHSPNEAKRSVQQWVMLGRMGMKKGFPDFIIPNDPSVGPNIGLELKRVEGARSKVSKEQTECLRRLSALGWNTFIAYGAEEAISWLQKQSLTRVPLKRIEVLNNGNHKR